MTGIALKSLAPFAGQDTIPVMITLGTTKPVWPTRLDQSRFTLGLGAKLLDKLRHRQAGLELHTIHGHDISPVRFGEQSTPICTAWGNWLQIIANQMGL